MISIDQIKHVCIIFQSKLGNETFTKFKLLCFLQHIYMSAGEFIKRIEENT